MGDIFEKAFDKLFTSDEQSRRDTRFPHRTDRSPFRHTNPDNSFPDEPDSLKASKEDVGMGFESRHRKNRMQRGDGFPEDDLME